MTATLQRLLLLLWASLSCSTSSYYYRNGRYSDSYGEYYLSHGGFKAYIHCYDQRFSVRHQCRSPGDGYTSLDYFASRRPYYPDGGNYDPYFNRPGSRYPYYPYRDYGPYFDGRGGHVNVGRGRFYFRRGGRDVVIECTFPTNNNLVSAIVWFYRGGRSGLHRQRYFHYRGIYDRVRIENFGPNGSRMVIRNFRAGIDDGVYRCFATRRNYYNGREETIYVQVRVVGA